MKQLSPFTEAINQNFGSNVAVPKGKDYGYLRRLFKDDFETVMSNFKEAILSEDSSRLISDIKAISYPTGYSLNDQNLYFIDFTYPVTKEGTVKFDHSKLPSIQFTKLEFESFALFHEIGHTLDLPCKYYDLEEEGFDSLAWQRECFADLYSAITLSKCLGSCEIIDERLIPFRTVDLNQIYNTVPALNLAKRVTQEVNLSTLKEKDIIGLAIQAWNNIDSRMILDWREESKINNFNLKVMNGCIESGSITNFVERFDSKSHRQRILESFSAFMEKNLKPILTNALHFKKPVETIAKMTFCLMRPIHEGELATTRMKTFDEGLSRYLDRFPDCPLTASQRNCQHYSIQI